MQTKEYLLTWKWNYSNSVNSLSTIHKSVLDKVLTDIKDRAIDIKLFSLDVNADNR